MQPALVFFASFLFALTPHQAAAQVPIAWKLDPGDVFYLEESANFTQHLQARGEKLEHRHTLTRISRFRVAGSNEDGLLLEQEILTVKLDTHGSKQRVPDSAAKKFEGAKIVFTLGPDLQIAQMEGHDKIVQKLAGKDDAAAMLEQSLTPEALRAGVESLFAFAPGKDVADGAGWTSTTVLPFGPLGKLRSDNRYTLQSAEPLDQVQIGVQSRWQFEEAPPEQLRRMKISRVSVDKSKAEGTVIFDAERGQLVRSELQYTLHGTIEVALPNNTIAMAVRRQGELVWRVSATKPK